jgi:hypothetical protein
MTLYNKVSGTETYQRTVISEVEWENRKAVNGTKQGKLADNTARVFVWFAKSEYANYLKPKIWQALTTKTGKWTLSECDVIVKGTVTDEIHPATPSAAAFTLTNLKAKYDDVLVITSVDTNDLGSFVMRHFEVGAK